MIVWSSNHKQLAATLRVLPDALAQALKAASNRTGQRFIAHHRKEFLSRKTKADKGVFARPGFKSRFKYEIKGTNLDNLQLNMKIRSRVAVQQEAGATLRARPGRQLTVPMPAAVDRFERVTAGARKMLARKQLFLFVHPRTMEMYYVQRRRGTNRLNFLFHLEEKVTLKPRLGFFQAWHAYQPKALQDFRDGVKYALKNRRKKGAASG